jgi:hypothetical protein
VVTVLAGKIGAKFGRTRIRDEWGFVQRVKSRELRPIDPIEPHATLKFNEGGSDF